MTGREVASRRAVCRPFVFFRLFRTFRSALSASFHLPFSQSGYPSCMTAPYDYVIIGSGFGGSVSALRLAEKGYRVLVLERGKRFRDDEFATSTWNARKYVWAPALRCFGILQISPFRDVFVLHGAGVGGGSLGYANVLMEPDDELFASPSWKHLADWKSVLRPHYATARRMLGVTPNPRFWPADQLLKDIAAELGTAD